jgi:sugar transferase (PEP-CTERM system associated)
MPVPNDWRSVWGIVVAAEAGEAIPSGMLLDGKRRGVRVLDDVRFWEQHFGRIDLDHLGPDRLLFADGFVSSRYGAALKRASDVAVAAILFCLTWPVMVAAALCVKLDSPGPLLYRQERVGLHGRTFTVLKFRSMRTDAEGAGAPRWAARRDPRVTRVGSVMRLTRIDELPQLFNVLRGEMSFVGPRPERPHFVEQLAQAIPLYRERSWVKPGITGWAQVNFPYGASIEDAREKLAYDLYYVKNRSLLLDLLIVVSTVRVIIFQDGAR